MGKVLNKINTNKVIFVFNIILFIVIPLSLVGLTFLQLLPIIIFFGYIILIFTSIKKETLRKIRFVFLIGIVILVIFLITALNLSKSTGLDFIGGLAIFISIFPIFVIGLIGLILSFIIDIFYDFWEKWKFKHILTILIIIIFVISFFFTYQYSLINFYFGNYDTKLCEKQVSKFVVKECIENLAILSNNLDFCNNQNVVKNICLYDLALKNNNKRSCEAITNTEVKERCSKEINK